MWGFLKTLWGSSNEYQSPLPQTHYNPNATLEIQEKIQVYRTKKQNAKTKRNKVVEALNGGVETGLLLALEILERNPENNS